MIAPALVILLGVCVSLLILARDWRAIVALPFATAVVGATLLAVAGLGDRRDVIYNVSTIPLVILEIASGATGMLMLTLTELSAMAGDEGRATFGRVDLARALRHTTRRPRAAAATAYLWPATGVVSVITGALLLPDFYARPVYLLDYAWTLLLLGGITTVVVSGTLSKAGAGLWLLVFALRFFYLRNAPRTGLLDLALLYLLPIMLLLALGYLSALLYDREQTPASEPAPTSAPAVEG